MSIFFKWISIQLHPLQHAVYKRRADSDLLCWYTPRHRTNRKNKCTNIALLWPNCHKLNNGKGLSHLILHYRIDGHCSSICTCQHACESNTRCILLVRKISFLSHSPFSLNHINGNSMHEVNGNFQIIFCYLIKILSKVLADNMEGNLLSTQTVQSLSSCEFSLESGQRRFEFSFPTIDIFQDFVAIIWLNFSHDHLSNPEWALKNKVFESDIFSIQTISIEWFITEMLMNIKPPLSKIWECSLGHAQLPCWEWIKHGCRQPYSVKYIKSTAKWGWIWECCNAQARQATLALYGHYQRIECGKGIRKCLYIYSYRQGTWCFFPFRSSSNAKYRCKRDVCMLLLGHFCGWWMLSLSIYQQIRYLLRCKSLSKGDVFSSKLAERWQVNGVILNWCWIWIEIIVPFSEPIWRITACIPMHILLFASTNTSFFNVNQEKIELHLNCFHFYCDCDCKCM